MTKLSAIVSEVSESYICANKSQEAKDVVISPWKKYNF